MFYDIYGLLMVQSRIQVSEPKPFRFTFSPMVHARKIINVISLTRLRNLSIYILTSFFTLHLVAEVASCYLGRSTDELRVLSLGRECLGWVNYTDN